MKEYVCIPKEEYDRMAELIDMLTRRLRRIRSTQNARGKYTVIRLEE